MKMKQKLHESTQGRPASTPSKASVKGASKEQDYVLIDPKEYENLKNSARIYDEVFQKCQNLEREIANLILEHNLSEEEVKNLDDKIKEELNIKNPDEPTTEQENLKKTVANNAKDTKAIGEKELDVSAKNDSIIDNDGFLWDKNNKTIPKDWIVGVLKADKSKRKFKCPDGFVFESRVKALEYMINNEYEESVLNTMRLNLSDEGWYSDKSCPGKWKLRKIPGKKDYEYLSPGMDIIPNMAAMLVFMNKKSDSFSAKDIKNLEAKIKSIERSEPRKLSAVNSPKPKDPAKKLAYDLTQPSYEESLPGGWRKKLVGEAYVYISPVGTVVHTLQQVLASIDKEKAEAKEREAAAKEAKPGEKRKFEEVFSSNKKDRLQVSNSKSAKIEITEAQLKVLEGVFQTAVIPEPEQIEELCKKTSLPAQEITKWFVKKLNEESKKRLLTNSTGSAGKNSPKGKESKSKVKVIETFKEMTKDHKRALEDIFKANQNPSAEMLTEVSSKLKIDLNLLTKWFSLRGQQKKK